MATTMATNQLAACSLIEGKWDQEKKKKKRTGEGQSNKRKGEKEKRRKGETKEKGLVGAGGRGGWSAKGGLEL